MKVRNIRKRRAERWLWRFRSQPRHYSLPLGVICWSHGKPRRGVDVAEVLLMDIRANQP